MGGRRSGIPVRHRRLSPQPTCRPNRHRNKPYLEAAKYEFAALAYAKAQGGPKAADVTSAAFGCRKSGLRHFFEVFIAPLRLRRGQGAMQRHPCYARHFADLPYTPPNPIIASGGCGPRTPKGFPPNPIIASGGCGPRTPKGFSTGWDGCPCSHLFICLRPSVSTIQDTNPIFPPSARFGRILK